LFKLILAPVLSNLALLFFVSSFLLSSVLMPNQVVHDPSLTLAFPNLSGPDEDKSKRTVQLKTASEQDDLRELIGLLADAYKPSKSLSKQIFAKSVAIYDVAFNLYSASGPMHYDEPTQDGPSSHIFNYGVFGVPAALVLKHVDIETGTSRQAALIEAGSQWSIEKGARYLCTHGFILEDNVRTLNMKRIHFGEGLTGIPRSYAQLHSMCPSYTALARHKTM
jgi:hypothetical protein